MSNEVRPGADIQFADKVRTIYPVSLRQLRKLRTAMENVTFDENETLPGDDTIDAMVAAAQIILEKIDPEVAADLETVEDIVDIKSFNLMVAVAMGADPNELEGILRAG